MSKFIKNTICSFFLLAVFNDFSQNTKRPFIWLKQEGESQILNKIGTQAWVKYFYKEYKNRLDHDLVSCRNFSNDFLRKIPFDWNKQKNMTFNVGFDELNILNQDMKKVVESGTFTISLGAYSLEKGLQSVQLTVQ